uniref:Superoxide dismutase [Cu-Zn] n=1 Tax=Oryza brachyantha TaxID=4533 RepID=J3MNV4_ORYBR
MLQSAHHLLLLLLSSKGSPEFRSTGCRALQDWRFWSSSVSNFQYELLASQVVTNTETMVKAVAVLASSEGVKGIIFFSQEGDGVTTVTGSVSGLRPGLHGFHVHALGDTTNGCMSTGEMDYGVLITGEIAICSYCRATLQSYWEGVANVNISDSQIPLTGPHSIIGRAVVVHADPDDLGKGGHELSKTTGNAGGRVACGIIGLQG